MDNMDNMAQHKALTKTYHPNKRRREAPEKPIPRVNLYYHFGEPWISTWMTIPLTPGLFKNWTMRQRYRDALGVLRRQNTFTLGHNIPVDPAGEGDSNRLVLRLEMLYDTIDERYAARVLAIEQLEHRLEQKE